MSELESSFVGPIKFLFWTNYSMTFLICRLAWGGFGCEFEGFFWCQETSSEGLETCSHDILLSGAYSLQTLMSVESGTKDGRTPAKMGKLLQCCK